MKPKFRPRASRSDSEGLFEEPARGRTSNAAIGRFCFCLQWINSKYLDVIWCFQRHVLSYVQNLFPCVSSLCYFDVPLPFFSDASGPSATSSSSETETGETIIFSSIFLGTWDDNETHAHVIRLTHMWSDPRTCDETQAYSYSARRVTYNCSKQFLQLIFWQLFYVPRSSFSLCPDQQFFTFSQITCRRIRMRRLHVDPGNRVLLKECSIKQSQVPFSCLPIIYLA